MIDPGPEPISASTRYCAVYGHPIRHSASPAMQNAGLAALGLDWRYLAFEVDPVQLPEAIQGARAMKFIGINLTVPHKLMALELVDEVDVQARLWGAVNTICFEARDTTGQWCPVGCLAPESITEVRSHGFNTDAQAIVRALREDLGLPAPGLACLLLGAGGAGRVAALKLAADGAAEIYLINRTREKAQAVADEIRELYPAVKVATGYPSRAVDLILNATSLGLNAGEDSPLDENQYPLRRACAVYDMIYRPAETRLLRQAKAARCRVANGLGMLLYQGTKALEIWSGKPAPVEAMRTALLHNVYGHI